MSKWVVLLFHPLDFGYITSSELEARRTDLEEINCKILAVSSDSVVVHEQFASGAGPITFKYASVGINLSVGDSLQPTVVIITALSWLVNVPTQYQLMIYGHDGPLMSRN